MLVFGILFCCRQLIQIKKKIKKRFKKQAWQRSSYLDRALGQLRSRILTIYALVDRCGLQKIFAETFCGQFLRTNFGIKTSSEIYCL